MTRELKLALIVGFTLVLVVTVLISDHLSKARQVKLDAGTAQLTVAPAQWPKEVGGSGSSPAMNPVPGPLAQIPESKSAEAKVPETRMADSTPREPSPEPLVTRTADAAKPASEPVPELRLGRSSDPLAEEIKARGGTIDHKTGTFQLPVTARVDRTPTGDPTKPVPGGAEKLTPPPVSPKTVTPGTSPGEQSYTIVSGDSAFKIAEKFYGDGKTWRKLAEYNSGKIGKDGEVRSGQTLRIPTSEVLLGKAAPKAKDVTKPADPKLAKADPKTDKKAADKKLPEPPKPTKTYIVQKGDSLGTIAQKTLGSSKKMGELLAANTDVIEDADNVPAGTVLKIPVK